MTSPSMDILFDRLARRGNGAYGLSDVTQLEHALQSADLAGRQGLGDRMVIAALFHDVGHMFTEEDVDLAGQGIDDAHEEAGAQILEDLFGPDVAEPVRLHVASKRYLCTVEQDYFDKLSEDSVRSLELQGGRMSPAEVAAFEAGAHYRDAIALRRIDDAAKIPGKAVAGIESYRPVAERIVIPAG